MAAPDKVRAYAADAQSDVKILRAIIFTSGAAADVLELKAGSSSGAVLITYKQPTANATIAQTFTDGVVCPVGNWYVEYTGTPGTVTLIGD